MDTNNESLRLIRLPAVQQITGMSRSGIYRAVAAGEFPGCIKLGARCSAWVEIEVRQWVQARINASRTAGA